MKKIVAKIVLDDGKKTSFKNDRPGRKWCSLFLKRHPKIASRTAEGISKGRAVITEECLRKWFSELSDFLKEFNLIKIFLDPRRVFNGDETEFRLCPKTGKVPGPKRWKNIYTVQQGNEKETITSLMTFAADGETAPPKVVFPYVRPPKELVNSIPKDWILGRSDSGWMTSPIFFEYICNAFNTWLIKKKIPKPVIIFLDGHESHLSMHLSEFCDKNGIIIYCLPPNSTHLIQPADVSVFKPLKSYWKKTVCDGQMEPANINNCLSK